MIFINNLNVTIIIIYRIFTSHLLIVNFSIMLKKTISVFILSFFISASYGQTLIWSEDFSTYADPSGKNIPTSGIVDIGDYPTSVSKWTLDVSSLTTDNNTDWFYVTGEAFSAKDIDAEAIWTSESINISAYSNVLLSIDLNESGDLEGTDYIKVFYKLDGGAETAFAVNGSLVDDFTSAQAWQSGLSGTSVVIVVRCINSADDEIYTFDNIRVEERGSSDIIKKSGWAEPTNIAYASYNVSSSLTATNSIEVGSFTIRDGGGVNDADNLSTILTDIGFTVDKRENLAALAIFDNTTNVAEVTSITSSLIAFTSLNISAADNSTKDFTVRATFKSTVTDNDNLMFTINSAVASASGSLFAMPNASGANTDNTGDNNKIVVTANHLVYEAGSPSSSVFKSTNFPVKVIALDANNNTDFDENSSVTLAKASGTGTLSSATGLTANLVNGVYSWGDVQYDVVENFTIEAQSATLTNITTSAISCVDAVRAWINEFHYDNTGTDAGEFVEICIENLGSYTKSNFSVDLYNGNGGASYDTKAGNLFTEGSTYDNITVLYYDYPSNGLQNGAPDGIAISYNGALLEFISYEGVFTATDGPAQNSTSSDVGVSQNSDPVGTSIQRKGDNDEWLWESGIASTEGTENTNQVLPIELVYFEAENIEGHIDLDWLTATETNNDFFTIERSLDAENFKTIGIVRGAGNSNELLNYSFSDNDISNNSIFYYRLKQTDYDGKYSYSKTISVLLNTTETQLLKQYVGGGNLFINLKSGETQNMQVELLDLSGKLIQSSIIFTQKGINNYRIQLQSIPDGIYLMRIYSDTEIMVAKVLVN